MRHAARPFWPGPALLSAWCVASGLLLAVTAPGTSLEDCITAALKNSPDAQVAAYRVDAARQAIQEAWAAYYPQVSAVAGYTRTDNAGQALFMNLNQRRMSFQGDLNNPPDTGNLRSSLVARMLLLDGGQRGLGRRMAQLGAAATAAQQVAVYNDLVYQVTRGYHSVQQAQEFIQIQEETVTSLEENLRIAKERVTAGSAVRSDVLNLEVQLAQAKEERIRARHGFQLAVAAVNTAIGAELVPEKGLPASVDKDLPARRVADSSQVAALNRPELEAAALNADILRSAWDKSRRDYLPRLSAFGAVDWDSDGSHPFERSYTAGVMLEWELFTGFRRGAAVRQAEDEYRIAQAEEQKARNNLSLDLKQAQLGLSEAWERLSVTILSVGSADEALRITRERYQKGAAGISELLTAQLGRTGACTHTAAAYYDYLIAQANLARATGELGRKWQEIGQTPSNHFDQGDGIRGKDLPPSP